MQCESAMQWKGVGGGVGGSERRRSMIGSTASLSFKLEDCEAAAQVTSLLWARELNEAVDIQNTTVRTHFVAEAHRIHKS